MVGKLAGDIMMERVEKGVTGVKVVKVRETLVDRGSCEMAAH